MLRLFDVVFEEKYTLCDKLLYLEACNHVGNFIGEGTKSVEIITKKIKALLSVYSQRTEGLAILQTFLPQCSTEVFSENALSWIQCTAKIIQNPEKPENKKLGCKILSEILPLVSSFSEIWRSTTAIIPTLVSSLLKVSPQDMLISESLELLEVCMRHFGGACTNQKLAIEKYILCHLSCWHGKCLEQVISCVALIPICGGGGNDNINHSNSWNVQLEAILESLTALQDAFLGISEIGENTCLLLNSCELPPLPIEDPLLTIFYQSKYYEFLSFCIAKMLSTKVGSTVRVPVEYILSHICRTLSVNSNTMIVKPAMDAVAVASVIPTLHCSALKILQALIACLGKSLIPHSKIINNLFLQTLQWTMTEENFNGCERPFGLLRKTCLLVLQTWLQVCGCGTGIHERADLLFQQIYYDIKPSTDPAVKLQSSQGSRETKHKNKKSKLSHHIIAQLQGTNSFSNRKINHTANWENAKEALKALKILLLTCGPLIKPDVHKQIHSGVVSLLLQVQYKKENPPIPYCHGDCRRELYGVLLASLVSPSPNWPPPLQAAIRLLSRGQMDTSFQVSYICSEAMAVCSTLIHPRVSIIHTSSPFIERSESSLSNDTAVNESSGLSEEEMMDSMTMPRVIDPKQNKNHQAHMSIAQVSTISKSQPLSQSLKRPLSAKKDSTGSDDIVVLSEENDSDEEDHTNKSFRMDQEHHQGKMISHHTSNEKTDGKNFMGSASAMVSKKDVEENRIGHSHQIDRNVMYEKRSVYRNDKTLPEDDEEEEEYDESELEEGEMVDGEEYNEDEECYAENVQELDDEGEDMDDYKEEEEEEEEEDEEELNKEYAASKYSKDPSSDPMVQIYPPPDQNLAKMYATTPAMVNHIPPVATMPDICNLQQPILIEEPIALSQVGNLLVPPLLGPVSSPLVEITGQNVLMSSNGDIEATEEVVLAQEVYHQEAGSAVISLQESYQEKETLYEEVVEISDSPIKILHIEPQTKMLEPEINEEEVEESTTPFMIVSCESQALDQGLDVEEIDETGENVNGDDGKEVEEQEMEGDILRLQEDGNEESEEFRLPDESYLMVRDENLLNNKHSFCEDEKIQPAIKMIKVEEQEQTQELDVASMLKDFHKD